MSNKLHLFFLLPFVFEYVFHTDRTGLEPRYNEILLVGSIFLVRFCQVDADALNLKIHYKHSLECHLSQLDLLQSTFLSCKCVFNFLCPSMIHRCKGLGIGIVSINCYKFAWFLEGLGIHFSSILVWEISRIFSSGISN